jgi:hypothetical protein
MFSAVLLTNRSLLEKEILGKAVLSINAEAQQTSLSFFVPLTKRKQQLLFCSPLSVTNYG